MMKKYNTPEIEALALETIDVIATSGNLAAEEELKELGYNEATAIGDIAAFGNTWSW